MAYSSNYIRKKTAKHETSNGIERQVVSAKKSIKKRWK